MATTNPGLPYIADTDVADTLAGVRAFEDGGPTDDPPVDDGPSAFDENSRPGAIPAQPAPAPVNAPAPEQDVPLTPEEIKKHGLSEAPPPAEDVPLTPDELKQQGLAPEGPDTSWTGAAKTGAREFVRSMGPLIASLPAITEGGALGAEIGSAAGPLGAVAGGLGGAALFGGLGQSGARSIQDYLMKKIGLINEAAEQAEDQAHPYAKMAGGLATLPAAFSPGKIAGSLLPRAVMGGAQAGQEYLGEKLQGQDADPVAIAAQGAAGAAFMQPRGGLERWGNIARPGPPSQGFTTEGQPYDPNALNGEIVPPGTPTPFDPQQLGNEGTPVDADYTGTDLATRPPSDEGPGNPPGQGSPGGGAGEAANDNGGGTRQAPGRPDTQPDTPETPAPANDNQINTPVPGGYAAADAGANAMVPTKGARIENTAPPAAQGLTPKSLALIAKSKGEAAVSEPVKVGIGTAAVQPPPPTGQLTIGNDTSAPFADRNEPGNQSGRKYAKSTTATTNDNPAGMTVDDGSGFTPDVTAVMKAQRPGFNANDNATVPGKPGVRSPGMDAEARNEPGNQPATNHYGFDINRPANENGLPKPPEAQPPTTKAPEVKPAPAPLEPHQLPERQPSYQDWRRGSSVYNPEVLAKYEAQLRQDIGPKLAPNVPETKSAGPAPAGHEIAQAEGQPEHPIVATRGPMWQRAMEAVERRDPGAARALEESLGGEEHASAILEGLKEIEAAEQAQAAKPRNALGKQTGDATKAKVANFKMQVADHVLDHFKYDSKRLPVTQVEKKAVLDNLHEALNAYNQTMAEAKQDSTLPTKGEMSGGQRWLKSATALLRSRDPSLGAVHKFLQEEFFHRHPDLREMAQETEKIETGSRGGEENAPETPDGHGWGEPDEPDRSTPTGMPHVLSPDDTQLLHDRSQLADNLEHMDHEAYKIDNGPDAQRQRYNTERPLHERLADIDHAKLNKQRDDRLKASTSFDPLPDRDLGHFIDNESGALNPQRVLDDFKKLKGPILNWYNHLFRDPFAAHRQGRMGSEARQMGKLAQAILARAATIPGMGRLWVRKLLDAHYRTFTHPEPNWNGQNRAQHIEGRNWEFLRRFEAGIPQATQALRDADAVFRRYLQEAFRLEQAMGAMHNWRENYMPHMFKNVGDAARFNERMIRTYGPTWFQHHRMFDTLAEARRMGFELKYDNPAELVSQRLLASVSMASKMEALQKLRQFGLAYQVSDGVPGHANDWYSVIAPNMKKWVIAPEAEQTWKNAMDREKDLWLNAGPVGDVFRAWMKAKAIWVPLKLAMSGFHLLHMPLIHVANAMTQGWNLTGDKSAMGFPTSPGAALAAEKGRWKSGAQATGELFTHSAAAALRTAADYSPLFRNASARFSAKFNGFRIMDDMANPGPKTAQQLFEARTLQEMGINLSANADVDLREAQMRGMAAGKAPVTGHISFDSAMKAVEYLNPLQKFLFKHLIPSWKGAQAMRAAEQLFHQHPEYLNDEGLRINALKELGQNIDLRYGEANYDALLWAKRPQQLGQATFLSLSWNVGLANQLSGALSDNIRSMAIMANQKAGRAPTEGIGAQRGRYEQAAHNAADKAMYVAHYTALALATTAALSYFLSGETPTGLDYVFPREGGINPDGSPKRLTTMHFTREPFMVAHHIESHGGYSNPLNWAAGAGDFLWSKMVLAPPIQFATNRDFFNREMSDPDADFFTQMGQRVLSSVGDLLTPITADSIATAERRGGASNQDKILSILGFGPAPSYVTKNANQNYIAHEYYQGPGAGTKPYANKARDELRYTAMGQRADALAKGDTKRVEALDAQLRGTGLKQSRIAKTKYGTQDSYQFSKLDRSKQVSMLGRFSQEEFDKYVGHNKDVTGETRTQLRAVWRSLHPGWRG